MSQKSFPSHDEIARVWWDSHHQSDQTVCSDSTWSGPVWGHVSLLSKLGNEVYSLWTNFLTNSNGIRQLSFQLPNRHQPTPSTHCLVKVTWLQLKSLLSPVDGSTGVPFNLAIIGNFPFCDLFVAQKYDHTSFIQRVRCSILSTSFIFWKFKLSLCILKIRRVVYIFRIYSTNETIQIIFKNNVPCIYTLENANNKMRKEKYHRLTDFFLYALLPNSRRP